MFITDDTPIEVNMIEVRGILEFENVATRNYVMKLTYLYVSGALICGSNDNEFEGKLEIMLVGDIHDADYEITAPPASTGVEMGSKAIGKVIKKNMFMKKI